MMSNAKIIQCYALYCIYDASNQVPNVLTSAEGIVNVPRWIVTAGWEFNNIDQFSGKWFGVSCVKDQVTDIDQFSSFTGASPPEGSLLAADGPRSTGAGSMPFQVHLEDFPPTFKDLIPRSRSSVVDSNANFQGLKMLRFVSWDSNPYNSSVPTALSGLQNLAF
ncbi:hypothetical protein IV203_004093 [Nitzschia inconspicua]|uniref:Uncharacterized protein n=1 Tax=Nitzschia inconspicua TaxID=303405 RepID=A0A9K3L394_9STRA|nr:hypothetical protein IV203_004093 [Nitzschia inconspicua]